MTYPWRARHRRHPVATPLLAAVAMAVSFLSPAIPEAFARTTTTAVPGSNCSAALSGVALKRTGWVASTNAPSSSADAPANALDGNYSTRFSTDEHQAPGLYFEVNMGSPQVFDEVKMAVPNSPTDYARGYDVEVSANGSTWATVASCTGTGTPETVSFPTQTAQYVRVVLTASTVDHWWSIDEFKLFSQSAAPTTTTTTTVPPTTTTTAVPGSNCSAALSGFALHRTGWAASTNAPSSSADAPANALDGNYSTRFSTDKHQAPGLYFEVNMGSPQVFDEVKMAVPNSPTDYARGYDVEVSANGSTWATVASCTGTGTPETVSFPTQTAQYVRVVLTASTVDHWWSIDEFKLFSQSAPPTTTTAPPPSTTTAPRPEVMAQTGVTRVFDRSVALRLRCADAACRGFINLWHHGIFLGRGSYALGAGATGTFLVPLDGRALGLVHRAPREVLYANQVVLVNGGRKVRRGTLLVGSQPRPVASALTGGPTRIFNRSVALRLRCAGIVCRGTIRLWHDGILLGQVGFALGAGHTGTFLVRLDGRALGLVHRAPREVLYANQVVLLDGGQRVRRGIRLIG